MCSQSWGRSNEISEDAKKVAAWFDKEWARQQRNFQRDEQIFNEVEAETKAQKEKGTRNARRQAQLIVSKKHGLSPDDPRQVQRICSKMRRVNEALSRPRGNLPDTE
jgi:hypothetical protein